MTFTSEGSILEWRGEGETLRIEPWGTDSVRIRSSKKMPISEQNWGLLGEHHEPGQAVRVEISEDQSLATLTNGNITVTAHAFKEGNAGAGHTESLCELSFSKADGTELFQEMPQHGALKLHARKFSPTDGGNQRIEATFLSPENEHLYGMGEYQQSSMDLKGCSFELAHRNSQASIPFVVSSAGYGFLWNNPAIGTAEFSKNRTRWVAESSRQLDYWVTAGNEPAEIERHYADTTGHAPKMPEWGLGFWQCKLRYWNQSQVLEVAKEFKRRNIPIDVLVIDFFHWPHMGDFRFEEEFWPNPKAMCEELHSMGIKVMVSVWPQISLRSENYEHMLENGLLVSAEHGIDIANMYQEPNQFYDATNPEAQAFVWNKCKNNYADLGVDAFWLDEAEPEYRAYDFDNYRYHAGPVLEVGNRYPRDFAQGFYDGLHMGMAGIPWFTTDMGGFALGDVNDPKFKELLVRWCQFSCFSPVMRNHGYRLGIQPDGSMDETITAADGSLRDPSGVDNEPWSYGTAIEQVLVKYINIRERMRPYTRELFDSAHQDGQPLIRGLFYECPEDAKAHSISDEYMFGRDFLVAPVVEYSARNRTVYLPGDASTSWTDLHTGASYTGGTSVTVDAPLDVIPVFAKNGNDHALASAI